MQKKTVTVYDEINTFTDHKTGEIISQARKQVVKREQTPEFIMLFVQGLSRLTKSELTKAEGMTLSELLKYTVSNTNMLMITADTKKVISQDTNLSLGTVAQNIKTLVTKEIVIRKSRTYFLNPLIFGRGNFEDLKKLTQSLEIEYDFINQTAVEKITTKSLYENVDKENITITGAEQNISEDGKNIEQKVFIEDKKTSPKEENKGDYSIITLNSNTDELEIEKSDDKEQEKAIMEYEAQRDEMQLMSMKLKLMEAEKEKIKAENRSKELENEKIKLELELVRAKNNKHTQSSLF